MGGRGRAWRSNDVMCKKKESAKSMLLILAGEPSPVTCHILLMKELLIHILV